MENRVKGAGPFDACDTGKFSRIIFAQLFALPDRNVFIGFADEKNLAILWIHRIGHEQEDRFFLIHAGEIK